MTSQFSWDYDRTEILADGFVHILGVAMAIAGAAMLINIAAHAGNMLRLAAIAIYLAGLLALFCFSAVYNLWPVSPVKWWLRRLDHSAIYLLIAATYTAFMLPIYGSAATEWYFQNRVNCGRTRAGHVVAYRCRRDTLFGWRCVPRMALPSLSECNLAWLCPRCRDLSLCSRTDVPGEIICRSEDEYRKCPHDRRTSWRFCTQGPPSIHLGLQRTLRCIVKS